MATTAEATTTTTAAAADGAAGAAAAAAPPLQSAAAASAAGAADTNPPFCSPPPPYTTPAALDAHVARAWAHFRALGAPALHVAPMVDASELPFRMLCRAHGATAAYTPMLHARLFLEHKGYRDEHFSTCAADRPLFAQFCANDPATFAAAAALVQGACDYVDLNLGCPQRIAKKGYYGSFLMDDLKLVEALVLKAASTLRVPVSVKIRLFPDLDRTIAYARMLEAAGASLVAVHGRTRDVKNNSSRRADWDAIAAVRAALRVPVLANGDVRCLDDARALMAHTGADGVLSAEPLLYYPALFDPAMQAPLKQPPAEQEAQQQQQQQQEMEQGQQQQEQQQQPAGADSAAPPAAPPADPNAKPSAAAADPSQLAHLERLRLCREYAEALAAHPVHPRMAKGHVHKLLQGWLAEHQDLRERVNRGACASGAALLALLDELDARVAAAGRAAPAPQKCDRKQLAAEREAARRAAIEEQEREAAALAEVERQKQQQLVGGGGGGDSGGGGADEPLAKRPCVDGGGGGAVVQLEAAAVGAAR